MTLIWILLGIVVLIFLLYLLCLRCDRRRDWKKLRGWRYAHRGFHDKPRIPENSLPAFKRAVQCGFGAELDVHLMKDGHLAVIHDASLLRTAGVDVQIEDLTAAELSRQTEVNAGTIRNLMTGRQTNISTRNLMTLARYFGMSMEEFIRKIQ